MRPGLHNLILALEPVAAFAVDGYGFRYLQERTSSVRQVRALAVDQPQLAL